MNLFDEIRFVVRVNQQISKDVLQLVCCPKDTKKGVESESHVMLNARNLI